MSMRLVFAAVAAVFAASSPASAQLKIFVDDCVSATDLDDVIQGCTLAITSEKMTPEQEARAFLNRGVAFYAQQKYSLAVRDYGLARQRDPGLFEIYPNLANAHLALDQVEPALEAYDAAVAMRRDDIPSRMGRGAARLRAGDFDGAVADFDVALVLDPDHADARYNRGLANLSRGRADYARADFTDMLKRTPGDAQAHLMRGQANAALGELHQAYLDYSEAIRLNEDYADAWLARGRLLYEDGQKEVAATDLRRAYDLGLQDPWLVERIVEASRN